VSVKANPEKPQQPSSWGSCFPAYLVSMCTPAWRHVRLLLPAALKRSNPQPVSLPWCLVVKQSRTAGRIWGRQKFSCRPFDLQIWAFKCIILIRIYKNVHCLWTKGIMYISLAWKSLDSQLKLHLICVYTDTACCTDCKTLWRTF